jgi:DNA-nicking Smr family endonuclease
VARDRRRLGPEEEALWGAVKKSVVPLHPQPPEPPRPPTPQAVPPPPPDIAAITPKTPVPPQPRKPSLPHMHTLGRRDRQKVVRGTTAIDARIDLHGLRQDEAHARLSGFLHHAQMSGYKLVLVITGKGRSDGGFQGLYEPERGVLRRMVPMWLTLPDLRPIVLGYEEAHLAHGGGGALYIRIRRRKHL